MLGPTSAGHSKAGSPVAQKPDANSSVLPPQVCAGPSICMAQCTAEECDAAAAAGVQLTNHGAQQYTLLLYELQARTQLHQRDEGNDVL